MGRRGRYAPRGKSSVVSGQWSVEVRAPGAAYSVFYAKGVKLQSPASSSARWVIDHLHDRTPTGFHKRRQGEELLREWRGK